MDALPEFRIINPKTLAEAIAARVDLAAAVTAAHGQRGAHQADLLGQQPLADVARNLLFVLVGDLVEMGQLAGMMMMMLGCARAHDSRQALARQPERDHPQRDREE